MVKVLTLKEPDKNCINTYKFLRYEVRVTYCTEPRKEFEKSIEENKSIYSLQTGWKIEIFSGLPGVYKLFGFADSVKYVKKNVELLLADVPKHDLPELKVEFKWE
jgi:hypothetical protein